MRLSLHIVHGSIREPAGVLKDRTDGELFRAMRLGYGKDNQRLLVMSWLPYRELSDDDIQAIIPLILTARPPRVRW